MKIHRNVIKHLGIAKSILESRIESWVGREPHPADPLKVYRAMLADVNYELHDIEVTEDKVPLSPRLRTVLLQYRGLLEQQDRFWKEHAKDPVVKWREALRSLDYILDHSETTTEAVLVPVTLRPDSQCSELGLCKIKVSNDDLRTAVPQKLNGSWEFGADNVYAQKRECLTCGKAWETSFREGRENTIVIKVAERIML